MRTDTLAVHATAVAIGARALLIRGPSRSGKSRLALALIAASTRRRPVRLIGDDRVLLTRAGDGFVAEAHPRIAGFIERRGLGLVAMPWLPRAPLAALVALGDEETSSPFDGANFPSLRLVKGGETQDRADEVLWWWDDQTATNAPHPAGKATGPRRSSGKD